VRTLTLLFILLSFIGLGQNIILDENYTDWNTNVSKYTDFAGDRTTTGLDFTDIRAANDDKYLFLYFTLGKEINIQSDNDLAIVLDVDNNSNTGSTVAGLGADLVYYPGQRRGIIYVGQSTILINHAQVGWVSSPTVTNDRFECSILRNINVGNVQLVFGKEIRFRLIDDTMLGDRAPNSGSYAYTMTSNAFSPSPYSIDKTSNSDLRVMGYNVLQDRMFLSGVRQNYTRIFNVIKPDIIGFCEIYNNSGAQTAAFVESILPSDAGQKWYHSELVPDIRVVSRYPILNSRSIDGNGAFLIDLGTKKLIFIVAHLPCCENEVQRQLEVDKIMAFIRGVRFGISPFDVPLNTPIIITGDMNLVGFRRQLETFLTGDILNNSSNGPDFNPDWDNTRLEDAKPVTTDMPMTFTWYNGNGSFSAGRLDFIFYSGSVLKLKNAFSLWTAAMTNQQLLTYGLQERDIVAASDHLPVVADFDLNGTTNISLVDQDTPFKFYNNGGVWTINSKFTGRLRVSDVSGKTYHDTNILKDEDQPIQLPDVSGLFLVTLVTQEMIFSIKVWN
jgi:endonuclease/exonuclease/phosphatase family metal-dependent hydrolase